MGKSVENTHSLFFFTFCLSLLNMKLEDSVLADVSFRGDLTLSKPSPSITRHQPCGRVNASGVRVWLRWSMATSQPAVSILPIFSCKASRQLIRNTRKWFLKTLRPLKGRGQGEKREGVCVWVCGSGRGELRSLRQCPSSPSGPPLINCLSDSSDSSHFHQDSQDTFLTRQKNDIVHAAYQACPLAFSY